ncbi:Peroxidase 2 [Hypsizygus marmoreus]|uniref:Peroxidase 2 n=1 Tax=Hypsizygus marmoreus TaxID=39966 RepID=A0A369JNT7_HYPMA|nr:Peroxidase 2 [Hypsizygus marmoreus]
MSRPTLTSNNGSNVKINVPPGWSVIVNAVTRKNYNQLLTCDYDVGGVPRSSAFANKWQSPNTAMVDIVSFYDQLGIIPQPDEVSLNLQFYYSKDVSVSRDALQFDKYKSAQANVLVSSKPPRSPVDFPDYVTFIVLVEDAPDGEQVAGQPRFDDVVATVNCIKNQSQTTPIPPPGSGFNLSNIQGDILPALPKALEYFYYFEIVDFPRFRKTFGEFIVPKITTSEAMTTNPPPPAPNPEVTFLGVNVGFTHPALQKFGLTESLLDDSFEKGQQQDAKSLGDAGVQRGDFWTPNWDGEYKVNMHGIFLITAYQDAIASQFVTDLEAAFALPSRPSSIKKVVLLKGAPRPGKEGPNDHFGYRGGMSNPQVKDVTYNTKAQPEIRFPGAPIIPMGTIVMGYDGDADKDKRPAWAKDGTFMVTRKLNNLVPEFDDFLLLHAPSLFPNLEKQAAADRLGSRLFGRWKNGTPTELSPDNDDPSIAADPKKINNFTFDQSKGQSRCPFASHMRKSNPRNDVFPVESAFKHFIRRHNMPYGPELTDEERNARATIEERGLHVVCYQSSIVRGFKFIQQGWYNDPDFPPNKPQQPGWDPIFGQTGKEDENVHRFMTGANPTTEQEIMTFPHKFIDPRGGEYFFSPSISTLRDRIATK